MAMSKFEQLLVDYPDAPWDWAAVSSNPSVSLDFVISHENMPWDYKYVSMNPSINEQSVRNHLDVPWNFEGLSKNPSMSLGFFQEYIIKPDAMVQVDWHSISANPAITTLDVVNFPMYAWDDRYLSANPNISSNFILNEGSHRKWFAPSVSRNPGISQRDIFKSTLRSMFGWDYANLSANPNLPIVYVNDNDKLPWNYYSVSINASLVDLERYQKVKWDGAGLSSNSNISIEFVLANPQYQWYKPMLCMNLSMADIIANYQWFLDGWNYGQPIQAFLSANPTITREWIDKNVQSIDWAKLSNNPLAKT